jgi:hypothetical protein
MVMDVLLVRRAGLTWALKRDEVVSIARQREGEEVLLRSGSVHVDAVLGVQRELPVHGAGPILRRLLPPACLGVAVVSGEPVAVLASPITLTAVTTGEGG